MVNSATAVSAKIASQYARARNIPAENTVRVQTEVQEEISREQYTRDIERPIAEWLGQQSAQDRILYIVLTKGVPLRIEGSGGRGGTVASVDSELTLLYRRLTSTAAPTGGPQPNPYYLGSAPLGNAKPFSHAEHDIYLVSRLDGFTQADALALIDRGQTAATQGRFLLDISGAPSDRLADGWLRTAADRLSAAGFGDSVGLSLDAGVGAQKGELLGYSSYGSNDPALGQRQLGLRFGGGALATLFVSTDARTLEEPPAQWAPARTGDPARFFKGSPQSLTGDLIRAGVTGASGQVAEPFLDGAVRPDILFPAYVAGFNLVESFYLAMPYLSWQTVVFGDPLCGPFRTGTVALTDTNPAISPETDLPPYFERRRIAALMTSGIAPEAAKYMLVGEARRRRGDEAGMKEALEKATAAAPGLNAAHLMLATAHEKAGEYDLAIERYRLILATAPGDAVAANNLAYALAVHKNALQEALPIAEKAQAASKGEARITDTLGWIHYLLGNFQQAGALLVEAAARAPTNPDIQLHLAHAYAALDRRDLARAALARTVQLNATYASREDVRALQAKLAN